MLVLIINASISIMAGLVGPWGGNERRGEEVSPDIVRPCGESESWGGRGGAADHRRARPRGAAVAMQGGGLEGAACDGCGGAKGWEKMRRLRLEIGTITFYTQYVVPCVWAMR